MKHWVSLVAGALTLLAPVPVRAQSPTLAAAANSARQAWAAQDVGALMAASPRVLVQLPGADPSAPVGQAQAVALVRDYLRRAEEVETSVKSVREGRDGRGFVELSRRYKVTGTQEIRTQSVLLSYETVGGAWVLVELRVSG